MQKPQEEPAVQQWSPPIHDESNSMAPWYKRNTIADVDHRALRKMIIPEPRVGLRFVRLLQEATTDHAPTKTEDITGKRRERKSVLPQKVWEQSQSDLQDHGIYLTQREKGGAAAGRSRATLTYYGTSAVFYNHQVKTKIRMRIRYYLSYVRDSQGVITDVQREGVTRNKGYLELKVKSPRAFEENSVDKYRVLVSDPLIAELVNLDPSDGMFLKDIERLSHEVKKENFDSEKDQEQKITTMFAIIASLAKRKAAFIRPSLVITYERSAYKYTERNYPVPTKSPNNGQTALSNCCRKGKRLCLLATMIQWLRIRRRCSKKELEKQESTEPASDRDSQDGDDPDPKGQPLGYSGDSGEWLLHSDDAATPVEVVRQEGVQLMDIEYQFTIDQNVRALYPLLPERGSLEMPVTEHFDVVNQTEIMRYPSDARVVEFKEPLVVATLPRNYRSATHENLIRYLVDPMKKEIMWGDYDENVGKYGNFRRRLMEEKNTDRIKNRMIEIDLTGSGLYLEV